MDSKRHRSFQIREKLVTCPFDIAHRVAENRLPAHIIACRKNHPNADMKTCPFHATHIVPKPMFQAHLLECPQKAIVERDLYQRKEMERLPGNPLPVVQMPQVQPEYQFENEEDWDSEMVESSFNPAASIVFKEFTRPPPPGCLGKSQRKEWREKEIERVERLRKGESIDDLCLDFVGAYGLCQPYEGVNIGNAGKGQPTNDLMSNTRPLRRPSAASLALSSKMLEKLSISDSKLAQDSDFKKPCGAEKGNSGKPAVRPLVEENKVFGRGIRLIEKTGPGLSLGRGRGRFFCLFQGNENPGMQS